MKPMHVSLEYVKKSKTDFDFFSNESKIVEEEGEGEGEEEEKEKEEEEEDTVGLNLI